MDVLELTVSRDSERGTFRYPPHCTFGGWSVTNVLQPPHPSLSLQGGQRPWFLGLHAECLRHPRQWTHFMSHVQLFQALLGQASHLTFKTRL